MDAIFVDDYDFTRLHIAHEFRTDRVIIEALDDSRFELDGEIIEDRYLDIKVVPNKLKMFM